MRLLSISLCYNMAHFRVSSYPNTMFHSHQMRDMLNANGLAFKAVTLNSKYVASLALTFQVDLVPEDLSHSISEFTSFLNSSESFSSFSNYSVKESGRGTLVVTVKGLGFFSVPVVTRDFYSPNVHPTPFIFPVTSIFCCHRHLYVFSTHWKYTSTMQWSCFQFM